MDATSKALFRAKLNAQKKDLRIDSPLVRYNESGQPVCKVCNIALRSESQWDAHQISKKHNEAVRSIKAHAAAVVHAKNEKHEHSESHKVAKSGEPHVARMGILAKSSDTRPSSALPSDFFDNSDSKKRRTENSKPDKQSNKDSGNAFRSEEAKANIDRKLPSMQDLKESPSDIKFHQSFTQKPMLDRAPESKPAPGMLPEGFFDDKEADLRARGVRVVKPDAKDEYKEFEKSIQDDIQQVDDRLEEEEIDAAEVIEEAESVEQRAYREKVELLKRKRLELLAAKPEKHDECQDKGDHRSEDGSLSSEDDGDSLEDFVVNWRAQRL